MPTRSLITGAVAAVALSAGLVAGTPAAADSGSSAQVFVPAAVVNTDHTTTLPLYRGRTGGRTVFFTVLEASDSNHADTWGASVSQKLANARGTNAVQKVSLASDGTVVFPATVDFAPDRVVVPGPSGFPPKTAYPGAVGYSGYSPLIQLPDGAVLNAPQLANDTGKADKAVALDLAHGRVRYVLTDGFARTEPVSYASTDASDPVAAALEDVTYAPALNAAPFAGGDGTDSARASLAAFTNGQTGLGNPQRQGLNSAIVDGLDPLNVLAWLPGQGRYSPLWDVHLTQWAPHQARLVTEFAAVADLARTGAVTGFGGGRWGPSGFIVDCPIIALR
jgi:hypothetical protein